ncbi:MAG: hypothetical protein D6722_27585, partial [Bacteroidetes bacterium]
MPNFSASHSIGRVVLDLQFESETLARTWQAQAMDIWTEDIAPMVEALLDAYASDSVLIQIDRIELQLDQLTEAKFEQEFPRQLAQQLRHWLDTHPRPPLRPGHPTQTDTDAPIVVRSWPEAAIAQLGFFLQHGRLPTLRTDDLGDPAALLSHLLRESPEQLTELLSKLQADAPLVAQRLTQRFSPFLYQQLMRLLAGPNWSQVQAFRDALQQVYSDLRPPLPYPMDTWVQLVDRGLLEASLRQHQPVPRPGAIIRAFPATLVRHIPAPSQRQSLRRVWQELSQQGPKAYQPLPEIWEVALRSSLPTLTGEDSFQTEETPSPPAREPISPGGLRPASAQGQDRSEPEPPHTIELTTRLDHFLAWLGQGQAPWWSPWPENLLPPPGLAFESLWESAPDAVQAGVHRLLQQAAGSSRAQSLPAQIHALLGDAPSRVLLQAFAPPLAPALPGVERLLARIQAAARLQVLLRPKASPLAAMMAAFMAPPAASLHLQDLLRAAWAWLARSPQEVPLLRQAVWQWARAQPRPEAYLRTLLPILSALARETQAEAATKKPDEHPLLAAGEDYPKDVERPEDKGLLSAEDPRRLPHLPEEESPEKEKSQQEEGKTEEGAEPALPSLPDVLPLPEEEDSPETTSLPSDPTQKPQPETSPPEIISDPEIPDEAPISLSAEERAYLHKLDLPDIRRLLQHLGTYGSLPPEAHIVGADSLGELVQRLIKEDTREAGRLLGRMIRQPMARQHLGRLLPTRAFQAWVATLPALTGN